MSLRMHSNKRGYSQAAARPPLHPYRCVYVCVCECVYVQVCVCDVHGHISAAAAGNTLIHLVVGCPVSYVRAYEASPACFIHTPVWSEPWLQADTHIHTFTLTHTHAHTHTHTQGVWRLKAKAACRRTSGTLQSSPTPHSRSSQTPR